jgi:preprotein translocase subunit SecE
MNRQAKRMMQRQKATGQDRMEAMRQRRSVTAGGGPGGGGLRERRKRIPAREFLKEVRAELRKVAWPSRQEMIAYTVVVLVSVVFLTSLVFGMDFVFTKGVLRVFGQG